MCKPLQKVLLLSLFSLLLGLPLVAQESTSTTADNLQNEIQNLESLLTDIENLNKTIISLEQQKLILENLLNEGKNLTEEQQKQLVTLEYQLTQYQSKVKILKKNYEGLLNLSKKLKADLELWRTATIVTGTLALIGVATTIVIAIVNK